MPSSVFRWKERGWEAEVCLLVVPVENMATSMKETPNFVDLKKRKKEVSFQAKKNMSINIFR